MGIKLLIKGLIIEKHFIRNKNLIQKNIKVKVFSSFQISIACQNIYIKKMFITLAMLSLLASVSASDTRQDCFSLSFFNHRKSVKIHVLKVLVLEYRSSKASKRQPDNKNLFEISLSILLRKQPSLTLILFNPVSISNFQIVQAASC